MPWELVNHKVYIDLTPSAGKALPYFLGKVKVPYNDPQRYSVTFSFSYKEAGRLGFSNTTYYRIICELVEKGFIDPVDKGGLRGCGRSYNLFNLSQRWKHYGTSEFKKINWPCFFANLNRKATLKMEKYNSKNGNEKSPDEKTIFKNDVVEAIFT